MNDRDQQRLVQRASAGGELADEAGAESPLARLRMRAAAQRRSESRAGGETQGAVIHRKDKEPDPAVDKPALPKAGATGILKSATKLKVGEADADLPAGTVVEVISAKDETLKVKVHSGFDGATAELPVANFQSQPGVAINSKTNKERGDVYSDFGDAKLWDEGGPKTADVSQGAIADCYLIAAMGAICAANPGAIQKCFSPQESGAPSYAITLHQKDKKTGKLAPTTVSVDTQLPTLNKEKPEPGASAPVGDPQLAYAGKGKTEKTAALWPSLLEKAYAQLVGGYDDAGKGGHASTAMEAITGVEADIESMPKENSVIERFKKYQEEGKAVCCGTLGSMSHKTDKSFTKTGPNYTSKLPTHEGEPASVIPGTLEIRDDKSKKKANISEDGKGKLVADALDSGTVTYSPGSTEMKFKADREPESPDNLVAEYDFRGKISKDLNLFAWHAYIFERVDGDQLIFKNPWGHTDPNPVKAADFTKLFSSVYTDQVPKPDEEMPENPGNDVY